MPKGVPQLPGGRARSNHQSGRSPVDILTAGFLAGGVSRTCTAPFDRLRSLMAAGHTTTLGTEGSKSISGGIRAMYRSGGLRCMWQGNCANVLQVGPESAILFFVNDLLKNMLLHSKGPGEELRTRDKFLCGASAGIISMTLVYPMYVVQNRMMVADHGMYKSIADCVLQTYRQEGGRAFMQGYVPSLIRIIPYKGIDLTGYTLLKESFLAPGETPTTLQSLSFGAIASSVSQTLTHPLLLARTKLQCQGEAMGRPVVYRSTAHALGKTFRRGYSSIGTCGAWMSTIRSVLYGVRSLWSGWGPSMAKNVPAIAIQFAVYEKGLQMMDSARK